MALYVLLRDEFSGRAYVGPTPLAKFAIGVVVRHRVLEMVDLGFSISIFKMNILGLS